VEGDLEDTSGRWLWWCDKSLTSDVFFQFAKQWQFEVANSRLYGGWRTRCQRQVSRAQWVVWTILGQAISCSGSTLVSRPGPWRRVASLGVKTSPYSLLESPSHHASWYLRRRLRVCPRVCCHHLTVVWNLFASVVKCLLHTMDFVIIPGL